ncbi:hypothetical protein, partial [Enterococcus faecium]|uniref:hypothetical protein n=1 Tax=Enterococcus faecium TaxID=1352 RepID=UPI00272DF1C9
SHQETVPQPTPGAQPSREEIELAKRYGTKDIAKAKERFQARQNEGRSAVSPTIALLVKEG